MEIIKTKPLFYAAASRQGPWKELKKGHPKPGYHCLQLFFCFLLDNGLSPSAVVLRAAPKTIGMNITIAQNHVVRTSDFPLTSSWRLPPKALHKRPVIPIQMINAQLFAIYKLLKCRQYVFKQRVIKKVTIRLIAYLLYHVSGNSKSAFADKPRRRHFFRNLFDIESNRFANSFVNSRTRWSQIRFHRVLQHLDDASQVNRLIRA